MLTHTQVEVISRHNRSSFPQTCQRWVEQPAVMYSGMGMDSWNIWHFYIDSFAHLFNTVNVLGLFDVSALVARCVALLFASPKI